MPPSRVLESLSGGTKRFSLEVISPPRGGDMETIMGAVEAALPWAPAFVSVTDHAKESGPCAEGGGPAPRPRPGTLGTAVAIRQRFGLTTVPHLVAAGAERLATEDLLIDLHWSGFHDLFVVRGDRPGSACAEGGEGLPGGGGPYPHAIDLLRHIGELNAGRYSPPIQGRPTNFSVGVAAYPEKHVDAPDLAGDLDRLEEKIRAGASFVISQMVFDAGPYRRLVEALRSRGLFLPVIPGLKPLLRRSSLELIPRSFFVGLPPPLVRAMEEARSPEEERRVGREWAIKISQDLLDAGAPCIHYFTMGRGDALKDILGACFP